MQSRGSNRSHVRRLPPVSFGELTRTPGTCFFSSPLMQLFPASNVYAIQKKYKKAPWRHRPETERFQMRRKGRAGRRRENYHELPRSPPALGALVQKCRESVLSQLVPAPSRYDITWHENHSLRWVTMRTLPQLTTKILSLMPYFIALPSDDLVLGDNRKVLIWP